MTRTRRKAAAVDHVAIACYASLQRRLSPLTYSLLRSGDFHAGSDVLGGLPAAVVSEPGVKTLTPVDTREQGFSGSTGVTENEKTPVFPGFFASGCFDSPVL
jgi:hypothetical protein